MKKIISSVILAASLSSAVEVGVLGLAGQNCPSGKKYDLYMLLNTENNKNSTRIYAGNEPAGLRIDGKTKDLFMFYCIVDSRNLRPVPYDYVVLRYDDDCPNGAKKFRRHHDTEDSGYNSSYGSIWPSVVYKTVENADIEFCYVPATPGATADFPLDGKYGVFADYTNNTTVARSIVHVDDEDKKNKNGWAWYGNEQYRGDIQKIVQPIDEKNNGHWDTRYHVSWRTASLAKSAAAEAPVVAGNVAADKPVAAEVKGFDRSAVTFELKSAGNAVVSIVNINGAVVAKVSKENLQPGVHSVEWHSGIVPNGRYVVTIEHNGVTSGKNVILK